MSSPDIPPLELDPDYVAENKGPGIVRATVTISAISTIFVLARLYTRGRILGRFQLDDYFIIVSTICGWISVGFTIAAVASGNGRHLSTLTQEEVEGAILWTIVAFPPGIMSFALPKMAVVSLLCRLLNPGKWHTRWLWAMVILCLMILMASVGILFAQCKPVNSQWEMEVEGVCIDKWILVWVAISAGTFSAFVDLYLAVYPAVVLWSLQMPIRKKLALCAALGIGSIAAVVAIYKVTRLPGLAGEDFTWSTSDLVIWTIVEGSTIIIATCIPVLQPLMDAIFGVRRGFRYKQSTDHDGKAGEFELAEDTIGGSGGRRGTGGRAGRFIRADSLFYTENTTTVSQETILKGGKTVEVSTVEDRNGSRWEAELEEGQGKRENVGDSEIVRTDVVMVEYGEGMTGAATRGGSPVD